MRMQDKRTEDRRIRKTEASLRGALAGLVREKPYDQIAVKEILNRANVGRSTFYTHFGDKDDLLVSCIHDMLGAAQPNADLLWFSLPILEHIEGHRLASKVTTGRRPQRTMHEHLEHAIAGLIEDSVTATLDRTRGTGRPSADLCVQWLASTFVLVLNWWVDTDSPLSARDADQLFRQLVEPALAKTLD
jgi:AcrR family transcriptional regulator